MHTKKRWKKILKKLTVMYIEKGLHEFTLIEKIIYIYIYFTQKTKINNTMIQYDYTTYIHMYLILKNTSIHTHYFTYFPIKTYYAKHNKTKK